MRILFAGIIARYPFGGVTWCSLMYLLGLRALGHEVFYIEDTGECVYDPVQNTRATDPVYGTTYIHDALAPFGLGDRWSFVNYDGSYHGRSADDVRRYAADADLFINLSGGSWFWRDEYARIPRKVFIDSDPAFTQLAIAKAEPWYVEFFQRFDHLFTFGSNIGTPASPIPTGAFTWHKTWQPVTLDDWRTDARAARPLHDGDDLADRELHRRRRQQGSGVREVHRPAVADAAALRARDQRPAAAAARARLGHGRRDARLAHAGRVPRLHPRLEGGVRRRQAHLRRDPIRLVQRSHRVLSGVGPPGARAGHRLDRAPAVRRRAARLLDHRRGRSPASTASTATTTGTRGGPARSRARTSTRASSCRALLETACYPLRIAHIAPVATTIPPPKSGSVETMTSLLTEGLVARGHDVTLFATADSTTTREAARDLPARLLARRAHVAVGAVRDAEPRRRRRARGRVRHHPLRGGVLPDVARLHAAVADADRPDAAPLAERRRRSQLWSRYPEAPFVAISKEQARLLSGLNVVGTVLHGIDTDNFTFRETPDDYLLFLGRFTEGKGVLQAIEIAKRVGMRLILAAAEDDYYREHVAPHVDGRRVVYFGEADFAGQGEAVRRRARAALPDSGARAVRPGARRGDGLRHAGRRARSRRGPRGRGRRRDRARSSTTSKQMVDGLPRVFALDRRRVRERAVARFGADAHGRRVHRRLHAGSWRPIVPDASAALPLAGRTVLAVFAHPDDESLACGGTLARLADAGVPRRLRLRLARRGGIGQRSGARARRRSRPRPRRASCSDAAAVLGVAEVIVLDHPTATCAGTTCRELHAEIVDADPALPARRGDHLRRGRPLLAPRSHRRPRADLHGGAVARRRRAAALLRHDAARRDARGRRRRARQGRRAARLELLGHRARRVRRRRRTRRPSSIDVRDWAPRKLAALRCHRTQMGPNNPFAWIDEDEARRWLGVEQFRRAPLDATGEPLLEHLGEHHPC